MTAASRRRRRPRPLTEAETVELLGQLRAVVDMACAEVTGDRRGSGRMARLERARRRAAEYAPGPRAAGGDGRGGGTGDDGVARPTERAALAPGDGTERWAHDLATGLRALCAIAANLAETLVAIEAHAEREITGAGVRRPRLGSGLCLACDTDASGVAEDRLRGGLCDTHRKQWERTRSSWHHDRVAFVRAVRAELGLEPLHPDRMDNR